MRLDALFSISAHKSVPICDDVRVASRGDGLPQRGIRVVDVLQSFFGDLVAAIPVWVMGFDEFFVPSL